MYSTDQMQDIHVSLTCLLLATNAFNANDKCFYRRRQIRLVIEKYTFSDVYERV